MCLSIMAIFNKKISVKPPSKTARYEGKRKKLLKTRGSIGLAREAVVQGGGKTVPVDHQWTHGLLWINCGRFLLAIECFSAHQ